MKQQTKRLLKSLCMAVGVVLLSAVDPLAGYATERTIDIKHLGEGQSIVRVDAQAKYLLLPVEESSPESKLYMIVDNDVVRTFNVRLAVNKVDYFVPVDLSGYADKHISFNFQLAPESALCWKEMKLLPKARSCSSSSCCTCFPSFSCVVSFSRWFIDISHPSAGAYLFHH